MRLQVADKPCDMLAKQHQEHSKLSACFSLVRNWQLNARIHLDSLKWNFARIHGFSPYNFVKTEIFMRIHFDSRNFVDKNLCENGFLDFH